MTFPQDASLGELGVSVRPVSHVEADVAAAATAAAAAFEAADFAKRLAALSAEEAAAQSELKNERARPRPNAQRVRAAEKLVEAIVRKKEKVVDAHKAREDVAQRAQEAGGEGEKLSGREGGMGKEKWEGVRFGPQRGKGETQREFDIRIGKITPFQQGGGEMQFERRRRRPPVRYGGQEKETGSRNCEKRRRITLDSAYCDDEDDDEDDDGDDDDEDDVVVYGGDEDQDSDSSFDPASLPGDTDEVGDDDEAGSDDWNGRKRRSEQAKEKDLTDVQENEEDEEVVIEKDLCLPASVFDKLFDYQKVGLKWMLELHTQQTGGILADEMGLGKTVQIVTFLGALEYSNKLPGPAIIVAPATVLKQWASHFELWWPRFYVRILHHSSQAMETSKARHRRSSSATTNATALVQSLLKPGRPGILVTSYEQVRKHQAILLDEFDYVVLDEGHKIRNPDADITLVCKRFRTPRRLLLTGTPMQNNLKELWSLFDFVYPGRLGTLVVFETQFSAPIALGGYANASRSQVYTSYRCAVTLKDLVAPYLLRRMKKDVSIELPEKQEQVLFCRLTEEQREAYKSFLSSRTIRKVLAGRLNMLFAVTTLRKICNHVDIATASVGWEGRRYCSTVRKGDFSGPTDENESDGDLDLEGYPSEFGDPARSGKLQVLMTVLASWHKEGHRVLIFCQTHIMLDIIAKLADSQGYEFRRMDGRTGIGRRMELIDSFNSTPAIFLFILSTRVGGLGTNLTGADRVVLYDPDWNPSTDLQARERAWRIGQTRNVIIYRLVTSGTIEEKILQRQVYKQLLSSKVLSDPRQRRFFKKNDMKKLFTLGEDAEGGTETGDLFAGTGAKELRNDGPSASRSATNSGNEVQSAGSNQILNELFNGPNDTEGVLQSAMNHDSMLCAGTAEVDKEVLEAEAEKLVSKAVEEVNRSSRERRREYFAIPTWTGRSGLAGLPQHVSGSGGGLRNSLTAGSPGQGSLLEQIKKREAVSGVGTANIATPGPSSAAAEETLLADIVSFLRRRNGVASSDDLVAHFDSRVGAGGTASLVLFKTMLKRVALLRKQHGSGSESVWMLRSKYRELGNVNRA